MKIKRHKNFVYNICMLLFFNFTSIFSLSSLTFFSKLDFRNQQQKDKEEEYNRYVDFAIDFDDYQTEKLYFSFKKIEFLFLLFINLLKPDL